MKSPFCSSKEIADIDLREIEPSATESDIEVSSSVRQELAKNDLEHKNNQSEMQTIVWAEAS